MVHVNCLKKYRESGSIGRLDVVVQEEEEQRNKLSGECVGFDQGELNELLRGHGEVFSDLPGYTKDRLTNPQGRLPWNPWI